MGSNLEGVPVPATPCASMKNVHGDAAWCRPIQNGAELPGLDKASPSRPPESIGDSASSPDRQLAGWSIAAMYALAR